MGPVGPNAACGSSACHRRQPPANRGRYGAESQALVAEGRTRGPVQLKPTKKKTHLIHHYYYSLVLVTSTKVSASA